MITENSEAMLILKQLSTMGFGLEEIAGGLLYLERARKQEARQENKVLQLHPPKRSQPTPPPRIA